MPKLDKRLLLLALLGSTGCAGSRETHQWQSGLWYRSSSHASFQPKVDPVAEQAQAVASSIARAQQSHEPLATPLQSKQVAAAERGRTPFTQVGFQRPVKLAEHPDFGDGSSSATQAGPPAEVTIEGVTYEIKKPHGDGAQRAASQIETPRISSAYQHVAPQSDADALGIQNAGAVQAHPVAHRQQFEQQPSAGSVGAVVTTEQALVPMNLPSVLAAIDGSHPIVGQARWRVQQAYARLAQAEALWLPSIQAGFSFHRHDGNYQASNGDIVDVNRNSFQYGLGVGATGAGTTMPRPGIVAQFHLADALFTPKQAEKTAWARGHAASATLNQQLLDASVTYLELVDAHQEIEIALEAKQRFAELANITSDFADTGQGLQADADRLQTELALAESRLLAARERASIAAAALAQSISLDGDAEIVPTDYTALAIDLVDVDADKGALVASALGSRPELKESQALVAAACEAYRREKYAAFVPSVLLGLSTGGFGGGLGNSLANVDHRYDFDAMLSWEMRNLGFGDRAARREQTARVQQARFEKVSVMDQIARDVSEAYARVTFRKQQIAVTETAVQAADDSYRRNLERIREGQGLPIEVLQSIQALESAQRAYLRSVIDHNQAQLQLQWAMGFPVS